MMEQLMHVIIGIVSALVPVLVGGIVTVIKAVKKHSPNGRLDKLDKSIKKVETKVKKVEHKQDIQAAELDIIKQLVIKKQGGTNNDKISKSN